MAKNPQFLIPFPVPFGAFLFLGAFAVYSLTLDPSLFRNDSPETITACFTLGISHPPGYPLHTLMGRLFSWLPLGNPAMTLNFFSAALSAFGVYLFFLNMLTLMKLFSAKIGRSTALAICLGGSFCFAFSRNYWSCALAAKGGIYNLQVVLELGLILFLQNWVQKERNGPTKTFSKNMYFFIFLFGLGLANHWPTQLLLLPALIMGSAIHFFANKRIQQRQVWMPRFLTSLALLLTPLSLYLYLPLRAHLYPHLNFGSPFNFALFCESLFRTAYFKTETLASFIPTALSAIRGKSSYIALRYWNEFNPLFALLSLAGIYFLWRKRLKNELLFLLTILVVTLMANLIYLQVLPIEYWHMDDHLLTVNWVTGLLGIFGIYWLFTYSKWGGLFAILLLPILTIQSHWQANDQKREFLYYGYGMEVLKSMDKGSFYFAESDYDYFSILYLTELEHRRPDIGFTLSTFWKAKNWKDLMIHQYGERFTGPHSIYCCFPNGDFMAESEKRGLAPHFTPAGTVVRVETSANSRSTIPELRPLDELWEIYLAVERNEHHPINGLLRELCAHPYINMAQYLKLKGDISRTSWLFDRALDLITNKNWRQEVERLRSSPINQESSKTDLK